MSSSPSRMTNQPMYYLPDSSLLNLPKLEADGGICPAPSYSSRRAMNILDVHNAHQGRACSTISKELLPYAQLIKNLTNLN